MKRNLTILICLFLCLGVWAQTASFNRARSFLGGDVKLAYVAETKGKRDFYVFNKSGEQGFVILTADHYAGEQMVLGYSDEGTFDYENLPDNLKWWLGQYQIQIEQSRAEGFRLGTSLSSADDKERHIVVHPLLGSLRWVQTFPFNNKTPKKFNDSSKKEENCPIGCVANTMGQVMYYYRWPLNPTGYHSYPWNGQTLSADFSQSEYDWSVMKEKYVVGQITAAESNAVSKLMSDCGISVDMDYDLGGSAAHGEDISNALKTYFRYKSANIRYRDRYSRNEWDDILRNQLQKYQPVIYGGTDTDEGHAFVCDGYDSAGYFHFNFGWGGLGDGYFLSSLPGSFSADQMIICDIVPDRLKYKSGNVFYNMLNEDDVEVSYPDVASAEYAGYVKIPDVTGGFDVISVGYGAFMNSAVDKVELPSTVRRISANAFTDCVELDTLIVKWNTPISCDVSAFDDFNYSNTVLVVPSGRVASYASSLPWSMFSHITDRSSCGEWSEWIPMESGSGVYRSGYDIFGSFDVSVLQRVSKNDDNKVQVRIEGALAGASLIVDVDMSTGKCKLRKQTTGFMNGSDEMLISDYPSYDNAYKYEQYPCTYDKRLRTISLNVVYSSGGHSGQYYNKCKDVLSIEPVSAVGDILENTWKDGLLYNPAGQVMSAPRKGINIRDGYKFLVE